MVSEDFSAPDTCCSEIQRISMVGEDFTRLSTFHLSRPTKTQKRRAWGTFPWFALLILLIELALTWSLLLWQFSTTPTLLWVRSAIPGVLLLIICSVGVYTKYLWFKCVLICSNCQDEIPDDMEKLNEHISLCWREH